MIRIAVLDRQPAVRAGLDATLRAQPGLVAVGAASELFPLLYRTDPDVLVIDDVALARRAKRESPRLRIVLYATPVTPELVLAAAVAGVDGVADKAGPTTELLDAIRGERALPVVGPRQQARAARRLEARDRPIFAMRLAGTSPRDIATVVGIGIAALNARIQAIVGQLAAPVPSAA